MPAYRLDFDLCHIFLSKEPLSPEFARINTNKKRGAKTLISPSVVFYF